MKKRTGKSPDLGDSALITVEVAILEGLLDIEEIRQDDRRELRAWKERVGKLYGANKPGGKLPGKSMIVTPGVKRLQRRKA